MGYIRTRVAQLDGRFTVVNDPNNLQTAHPALRLIVQFVEGQDDPNLIMLPTYDPNNDDTYYIYVDGTYTEGQVCNYLNFANPEDPTEGE